MADAEDLKSSRDFSSCGFDSHPGHQLSPQVCFDGPEKCPPVLCRSVKVGRRLASWMKSIER